MKTTMVLVAMVGVGSGAGALMTVQEDDQVVEMVAASEAAEPAQSPPISELVSQASEASTGEIASEEVVSASIGGVVLPDFGDGTPFDHAQVTERESEVIMQIFSQYLRDAKKLDQRQEKLTSEKYDALHLELLGEAGQGMIDLLGWERTHILANSMKEYQESFKEAYDAGRINVDSSAMETPFMRAIMRRYITTSRVPASHKDG